MPSEIFHWLVSLAEVLAVIATILLIGLALALAAFWVLARIAGRLAGVDPDSDSLDDDFGDYEGEGIGPPCDDSSPEEPSVHGR